MSAPERLALAVAERPRSLVHLMARKDKANALAAAIKTAFGLGLPPQGRWAVGREVDAIWIQPDGWLPGERTCRAGCFVRAGRGRDGGPRRISLSEQRPQRHPLRRRAGPVRACDLRPSRPPSARLRPGLGGDDARLRMLPAASVSSTRAPASTSSSAQLHARWLIEELLGSLRPLWRAI